MFFDEISSSEDNVQPAIGIHLHAFDHLMDNGIIVFHLSRRTVCYNLLQLKDAVIIPLIGEEGFFQLLDPPLQELDGIG